MTCKPILAGGNVCIDYRYITLINKDYYSISSNNSDALALKIQEHLKDTG